MSASASLHNVFTGIYDTRLLLPPMDATIETDKLVSPRPLRNHHLFIFLQDSAGRNGKKGTRAQCIAAATAALARGCHVAVDRCHVDAVQRQDFVQLAHTVQAEVTVRSW